MPLALDMGPDYKKRHYYPRGKGQNFGKDWLSLEYARLYPKSKRTKLFKGQLVNIESEHGLWRMEGQGYCTHRDDAWAVDFETAFERTSHCGPEKSVRYYLLNENS